MANTNTGRFILKGKKPNSEIEEFEELLKKKPDDDRAYVRLAELYARAGNEDKAIELYEKAALLFEKKGFLNKAKAVLKQAIMLNPEHGKINVLLADFDRQSGLIKDATVRYQTAVNYYAKIGNKLAAINILRKIIELYPGNINFILKLANMLVSEKMNHEAEKLLVPLADSLKNTDKVNEYATVLKLLYTATNNDSEIGKSLVNLYLKSGSYTNALVVLQKLIIDNPDAIEFLEKLAFVFEKLGDKRKLIAVFKQIASVYSQKQNYIERDSLYRKILEIDPDDRESLSGLNEQGKLRDLISDKIDSSSMDISNENEEDEVDLVLDIDIDSSTDFSESEEPETDSSQDEKSVVDIETVIKEATVFMNYRLFNKAIDKIQTCPDWAASPEAMDILIQSNIELGEVETAGDLIISFIDLMIEKGDLKEASDLILDAGSILGRNDQRIIERKKLIDSEKEVEAEPQSVDHVDSGLISIVSEAEGEDLEDMLEEPAELIPEKEEIVPDNDFASMTQDILSELQEPSQEKLDELEFYISIDDFSSANQLLHELLINYPDSRFLAGIKELIPTGKEEDLSGTVESVKESLRETLETEDNSEQLYDLALSHLSMGMFSEAISLLNSALDSDPENVRFMVGLANAWLIAEHPEKSIEMLRKALNSTNDKEVINSIKEQISEIEKNSGKEKTAARKGK
ncbi:MAG TPA: tetratricopeptide repeat protein [bacterium]|nr:tetratricopeptide repeat protein [bacterium]HPS30726.1 tetratricopeptide repeat protein [bacterium]